MADLESLAGESDILFLCAAGKPKGIGAPLVGRTVFDALGPDGIFINVARGWLVDEQALIDASGENVVANLVSWFEGTGPVTPVTR